MLSRVINFFKRDIWRIRLKDYPKPKSFFLRQLRIILLALRRFSEDKCSFRASALTFFSLLSIVPVIAMIFGIAKGFGLQERLKTELLQKMQGQEATAEKIINFANKLLENTNGGIIAGIGVLILFWSVIKVLSNIENSFNDIWGVKTPRGLARKFSDYLSMILICPFLLIISSSLTVTINSQVEILLQKIPIFNAIGPFILFLLKFLPYCTIWVLLTFIFNFLPNTKVKWSSAIIAGIVAGTVFQIVQWIYVNFQIGVAQYNAIYGSFAALPLFLMWLQTSWLIVLFGAELSFAHQNVGRYEFEEECLSASNRFKKLIALLITHQSIKNFSNGQPPLDAADFAHKLDTPIRLVRLMLFELVGAKILSEVKIHGDKDAAYQPAIDVGKLSVQYVIESLERRGISDIPIEKTKELEKLSKCLSTFASEIEKSPTNILLKNL